MADPCTLIATAVPNPENMADMQTYMQEASRLTASLGGGPPTRMPVSEVVAGESAAIVMVMQFPDREKLSAVFASDEYQALIPVRSRGLKSINIWIAGPM